MQKTSMRTLVLMMLLLGYVLAHQHLGGAASAGPHAVWLLTDPNDPNEPEPMPEFIGWIAPSYDEDPNDPNEPDPMPEIA